MQWDDLLNTADDLVSGAAGNRRPRQSNLRRAVSTAYYAMFHCLASCCANSFVGGPNADRSKPAWRQAYRALEHGLARSNCKNKSFISKFPREIENFANAFVALQEKRHLADYDPSARFSKHEVRREIAAARAIIEGFQAVRAKHRRAFAVYVLFRTRAEP